MLLRGQDFKNFLATKMNENVRCSKAVLQPSITAKNLLKFVWWCIFFRSRTWGASARRSICQEMCLETQTWYILGKKCARYYSGSIALATHAPPQRVQFIIDGCREALRVILLAAWIFKKVKTLHDILRDKKRTSQNHISIIVESFMGPAATAPLASASSVVQKV